MDGAGATASPCSLPSRPTLTSAHSVRSCQSRNNLTGFFSDDRMSQTMFPALYLRTRKWNPIRAIYALPEGLRSRTPASSFTPVVRGSPLLSTEPSTRTPRRRFTCQNPWTVCQSSGRPLSRDRIADQVPSSIIFGTPLRPRRPAQTWAWSVCSLWFTAAYHLVFNSRGGSSPPRSWITLSHRSFQTM